MKKRALLALLTAMTLLLSSCALIEKDAEVDAATVILKMGDKVVTKAEAQKVVNDVLNEYYNTYGSSIDLTSSAVQESAQKDAVTRMKQDMVLRAKMAEFGIELNEEETEKAKASAQSTLDYARSYVTAYMIPSDTELEGDALEEEIQKQLANLGVSAEVYEKNALDTALDQKLKDYVVKDVTIPDEDVKADYDSKVASDEEKYKENAGSWCSTANNGTTTLYYTPAGVRRVKQILIKFTEEDQTAIDDASSNITAAQSKVTAAQQVLDDEEATEEEKTQATADKEAAEAELEAAQAKLTEVTDTAFTHIDEKADAVLAGLEADPESWESLLNENNDDPGMFTGETAEKGYAISADMTSFDPAFVEAGMALAKIGDVSGKVRGNSYGYYIIKYVGDETEGPVPYESVEETVRSALLTTEQNTVYNQTVERWIEEAKIEEHLNDLKD